MKTTERESPSTEAPAQRNPCHDTTDKHLFALCVTADDGHDYFFGTTQFIEAELAANDALEKSENAPTERLDLRYATGEAVILGQSLRRLAQLIQRGELENIRPLDRRYAGLRYTGPIISSIVVTRKEVV
ncbi:MAG TPA: hypothetical protein VKY92_10440 [Verrucomicrobiae bacterium]|jgi:hypothetical protein|nr:hypothetical protein [Verrucomicrobiae bacterium]